MSKRKIKMFYLPFNRDLIFVIVGMVLLLSFGVINFDDSKKIKERAVFKMDKAYYQGPSDKQKMALTINVAWGEDYLPQILEVLDRYKVKATFFFVGRWVEKFPELTKEIEMRGHEIGNHGHRHLHPKNLSKENLIKLIKDNEKLLQKTTDYKTNLFAPPYGEVDDRVVKVAGSIGYRTIMWTIDTIDWQKPKAEVIIKRVLDQKQAGGIVLMHPTESTLKALPEIIKELQKEYQLVTVTQLLE